MKKAAADAAAFFIDISHLPEKADNKIQPTISVSENQ